MWKVPGTFYLSHAIVVVIVPVYPTRSTCLAAVYLEIRVELTSSHTYAHPHHLTFLDYPA
jgi:hypothetical protein